MVLRTDHRTEVERWVMWQKDGELEYQVTPDGTAYTGWFRRTDGRPVKKGFNEYNALTEEGR